MVTYSKRNYLRLCPSVGRSVIIMVGQLHFQCPYQSTCMNTGQGVKDDSGISEPQSAAAGWSRGGNFKHVTAFLRLCVRLRVFFSKSLVTLIQRIF